VSWRARSAGGRPDRTLGPRLAALLLATALAPAWAADLIEIYDLALTGNPEYLAAGAANRAAQEARPQARSALLPTIRFDASSQFDDVDRREPAPVGFKPKRHSNRDELELSLTQPIYRKDLWIALEQADTAIRSADTQYALARQLLMLDVAERYFEVLSSRDEVSFGRATVDAFEQQLKQSQQRFEVGLIAITDVEEAKAGFDRARADLIEAENRLENAYEALRETSGRYYRDLASLSPDLPLVTPEPDDIDAWTETSLIQNFGVMTAQLDSEIARDEIKRVSAGHLPELALFGSHNRSSGPNARVWTSSVGLALNVPIYEGGLVMSRTRESRQLYQQSLDDLERRRRGPGTLSSASSRGSPECRH
jgi:outer membrane protein